MKRRTEEDSSSTTLAQNPLKKCNTTSRKRQFKSLPVFLVDYHHHVLEFIYRCVGSRHLPLQGTTLIHFDSHPDMVISRDILAKDTYDKQVILEKASIESWIMPLCYTGIITRIVWIKNSWCKQLPIGKHNFHIGEHNGELFVDLALPYFLAEGNYCDTAELSNARNIELHVMDFNAFDTDATTDELELFNLDFLQSHESNEDGQPTPYILDIDLDFFSVNNPFLHLYDKSQSYEKLERIFAFDQCATEKLSPMIINQHRIEKLEALKCIFQYLETHSTLQDYRKSGDDVPQLDARTYGLLEELVESLKANYSNEEKIEWMLVYDAGCTADSGGLPQYNSTENELLQQYEQLTRFLQKLPYQPVAVTIARSAEDYYCPVNQVDDIQENVIRCLNEKFARKLNLHVINEYLDEVYDIMAL